MTTRKWEANRGIGRSYGYNRNDTPADHLSGTALIHLLVDVVSKNGNLLLGAGPTGEGALPPLQVERLHALGDWLEVHGEAIFGTRPWSRAEGRTDAGVPVRFTHRDDTLYATMLGEPTTSDLVIEGLRPAGPLRVRLLGWPDPLDHAVRDEGLSVGLPRGHVNGPAPVVAISPVPPADR